MFSKKKCQNCKKKVSEKFSFCPTCGKKIEVDEEDYGMLGKNDIVNPIENFENGLFGGINSKILNKMMNGAMKMLENEMRKGMESQSKSKTPKTNFELYINGKKINPENIIVQRKEIQANKPTKQKIQNEHFDEKKIKEFAKLEKVEPKTNIRRLSNKVIYEIEVPGVESIDDVSIIKLENSLEIKAISKEKAYKKTIPIDLPLKKYKLENDKIVLELGVKD
jgi:HSP20 family molecular chaperone IbpA